MAEKEKVKATVEALGEETHEFLAGYIDMEGNVHKEFEINEITGVEEEAIAKKGTRDNGGKLIRVLLERCIVRIGDYTPKSEGNAKWRDIIQALSVADQDYALLKLRELTLGSEIEMAHKCPNCSTELKSIIDMNELEIKPFGGDLEMDFELPKGYKDKQGNVHRLGKMRFPNGEDREVLDMTARNNMGTANTMLLTRCIVELGTVKIHDQIIRNMSLRDRDYLLKLLQENAYGLNLQTEIICVNCGEDFMATLNMVNFL